MKSKSIIKSSKLPSFIKHHEIFKQINEVKKIFPLIGLKNGFEPIASLDYAKIMAPTIRKELSYLFKSPNRYFYNQDKMAKIYMALQKCTEDDFIIDNKVVLTPNKLKKIGIRNIKEAYYNYAYSPEDRKYAIEDDEDFEEIPKFNSSWKVVFSSDGPKGVWDIATMSMRGISSCQAWSGSYFRNLIGSIVDPFVGVIYITNGKNYRKRGQQMLYRCVVRYVINRTNRTPALMLEPIYSVEDDDDYYEGGRGREEAVKLFKLYLEKHLSKRIPITMTAHNYEIPNSSFVEELRKCGDIYTNAVDGCCLSYRDSGINYAKSSAVRFGKIKAF